jgi:hypothetical protein
MKITRRELRSLILKEISSAHRDPESRHRSELSYATSRPGPSGRSRKGLQKQFHKASRRQSRRDIESQVSDLGMEDELSIAELVEPLDDRILSMLSLEGDEWDRIKADGWNGLQGAALMSDPETGDQVTRSKKDGYLGILAWEVAYNPALMDFETIEKLAEISPLFNNTLNTAELEHESELRRREFDPPEEGELSDEEARARFS